MDEPFKEIKKWQLRSLHSEPRRLYKTKSKSLDHVIEGSYDLMGGNSSGHVTTPTSLLTIGIVIVEIKCLNLSRAHT